jgi:hypothetical protein
MAALNAMQGWDTTVASADCVFHLVLPCASALFCLVLPCPVLSCAVVPLPSISHPQHSWQHLQLCWTVLC